MLYLSELMLQNNEITSFQELIPLVKDAAKSHRFFKMDVKPPYGDTPENWEDVLEGAFSGVV